MRNRFSFFCREGRSARGAANTAIFGARENQPQHRLTTELPDGSDDPTEGVSRDPSRDLELCLKPPTRGAWLSALSSIAFCLAGLWFIAHVSRSKAATTGFLISEVLFVSLGIYWMGRGMKRGWPGIVQGGIVVLLPWMHVTKMEFDTTYRDRDFNAEISVKVVDAKDNRPVPAAIVRAFQASPESTASGGRTNASGGVKIDRLFRASVRDTPLRHEGTINMRGQILQVNAEGYEVRQVHLDTITGASWDICGPPIPQLEVRLVMKQ
jgi:hypothetical protein